MSDLIVHLAPAVVPVTSPPLTQGAVAVADGRIVAVGARDEILGMSVDAATIEWEGVLIPGLVNAHTHLQYTSFAEVGALAHPSYVAWSERFVTEYEARRSDDWGAVARAGVEMGLATGTTCFADVVTDLAALDALADMEVSGVSYFELIGVDEEAWEAGVGDRVTATLRGAHRSPHARVGLSPHAPYSVDEPVLKKAAALARAEGVRLHIHLAESDSEDSYYRTGTGALAERVTLRVGRPWSILARGGTGLGAAEFAAECGLLGGDSHVAHGVYLGSEGRAILRRTGTYVALCPRSNLTVGIEPPPVADFLAEESPIAVGTDSLASNTSLDLLEDVALLRRLATEGGYTRSDLDRRLLHAATMGGATAIGLSRDLGSLGAGKRADMAVIGVDPDPHGLEQRVVEQGTGACLATLVGGEVRWRR
ncbi:MAG TPA: amidohydrolase family protein [Acidimicrobiia bacterium]|nr:amidohydrolase family protein [Acidimicrobiia bacterium]